MGAPDRVDVFPIQNGDVIPAIAMWSFTRPGRIDGFTWSSDPMLGGCFWYFLFSPLFREDSHFDLHIFFRWVVQPPTSMFFFFTPQAFLCDFSCEVIVKEVKVKPQPAKTVVKAFCVAALKQQIWARQNSCCFVSVKNTAKRKQELHFSSL